MKIDVKDIRMGFWFGVGFLLLSTLIGLITRVWAKATDGAQRGD